jgi:hypothetical protein
VLFMDMLQVDVVGNNKWTEGNESIYITIYAK